jgi:hypothetical protein
MNMIVGKKQIVLSVLVLALGVAVYLNYQYSQIGTNEFPITDAAAASTEGEFPPKGKSWKKYMAKLILPKQSFPAASRGMRR